MDWESIRPYFEYLTSQLTKTSTPKPDRVEYLKIERYRLSYLFDTQYFLLFSFISDLTDSNDSLIQQLKKVKSEFLSMYGNLITSTSNLEIFASFNPVAELVHQSLRPKISIIGFPGVGKTTITKLIRAEEIPLEHVPTVTGDISAIKIGKLYFNLWDFAGQEQYSFLWPEYLQNSNTVLLITDSTLQNIDQSKFFIDLTKTEVPDARLCVIANKQDLSDAMSPEKIERLLGVKTYGMIAIDPQNREKMIHIIAALLDISPQVSHLIRSLLDRDKALEEAEALLMEGDFEGAIQKFNNIAALCRELGDDKVSLEFLERARLIQSKLKGAGIQTSLAQENSEIQTPQEPPTQILSDSSQPKVELETKTDKLGIPEIPANSRPIHPVTPEELTPHILQHNNQKHQAQDLPEPSSPSEPKPIPTEQSVSSPVSLQIREHYNFVDRNIFSFLSKNPLNLRVTEFSSRKLAQILANSSTSTPLDFINALKTQINTSEILLFPSLETRPTYEKTSQIMSSEPIKKTAQPSTERIDEDFQSIQKDENLGFQDKIKKLRELITSTEAKISEIKINLENGKISEDEYKKSLNHLREKKKLIQEKISDLNIQQLKNFKVSIPD